MVSLKQMTGLCSVPTIVEYLFHSSEENAPLL